MGKICLDLKQLKRFDSAQSVEILVAKASLDIGTTVENIMTGDVVYNGSLSLLLSMDFSFFKPGKYWIRIREIGIEYLPIEVTPEFELKAALFKCSMT